MAPAADGVSVMQGVVSILYDLSYLASVGSPSSAGPASWSAAASAAVRPLGNRGPVNTGGRVYPPGVLHRLFTPVSYS